MQGQLDGERGVDLTDVHVQRQTVVRELGFDRTVLRCIPALVDGPARELWHRRQGFENPLGGNYQRSA
jgi:hypothetical protein